VHDDVMLEVDEAALPELAALTRAVMVQAGVDAGVRAPLAVRLRHGPNWHALADMD
jgi:DNA polymerase I-like protein with 3'-5' exonuclease and polymerase domains